jgi:hypothetical protein
MKLLLAAAAAGWMLTMATPSGASAVLLNLNDPPIQSTMFDLSFRAYASETTLSVGGYQVPSWELVYDNSVSTGAGPNLLGGSWNFVPAASGSNSYTFGDGTPVPALGFGSYNGYNDTYSQTFATTPGATYTYAFTFNELDVGPSALLVTTSVPEPSTWAMMLLGFAGLGFAGYRRVRGPRAA